MQESLMYTSPRFILASRARVYVILVYSPTAVILVLILARLGGCFRYKRTEV